MPLETVTILDQQFRFGDGMQNETIGDWRRSHIRLRDGDLTGIYLKHSVDTPLVMKVSSFKTAKRSDVLIKRYGEKQSSQSKGAMIMSLRQLHDWQVKNSGVTNINVAYECILGGNGYNYASCLGFDIDNKQPSGYHHLPDPEMAYRGELFLPWMVKSIIDIVGFLGHAITSRDMYVSQTSFKFDEAKIPDYKTKKGPLSYHINIPKLHFTGQEDRNAFRDILVERSAEDSAFKFIDSKIYTQQRDMRLLGNRKMFEGEALMPLKSVGDLIFADEHEYRTWAEIPLETRLKHVWSLVPDDSERLLSSLPLPEDTEAEAKAKRRRGSPTSGGAQNGRAGGGEELEETGEMIIGVYEQYATTHNIPFVRTQAKFKFQLDAWDQPCVTILYGGGGECRVCPMGRVHDSNTAKLTLREGRIYYYCFGSPTIGFDLKRVDAFGNWIEERCFKTWSQARACTTRRIAWAMCH